VPLELPSTDCHGCARIHILDANYGNTGAHGAADTGIHISHNHNRMNVYYAIDGYGKRAVACQENGHALGLGPRW
jgi:hypothetical protein